MLSVVVFLLLASLLFAAGHSLLWIGARIAKPSNGGVGNGGKNGNGSAAFGPLTRLFATVLPPLWFEVSGLDRDLRRAGYYSAYARLNYLSMRNVVLMLWGLFIAVWLLLVSKPGSSDIGVVALVGLIGAVLIYGLPRIVVGLRGDQRVAEIQAGLPDALDVITMAISGGLPLQRALDAVSDEIRTTHRELGREFDIIRRHAETSTLDDAFERFADRVDAPEVRSLAAIVSQSERLGANIAAAFREYSDGARRSYRQRTEERATKTSVKLLFPVAMCLAPPTYILLLGPAFLELRSFVQQQSRTGGALSQSDPSRLPGDGGDGAERLREMRQELEEIQRQRREFMRQGPNPSLD